MNKFLLVVCLLVIVNQASAFYYCGSGSYKDICTSSAFDVYCCGYLNRECCYGAIYEVWWFWIIWVFLFLVILCCSFGARRRRLRLLRLQQQQITQQQPAVVTVSTAQSHYPTQQQYPYQYPTNTTSNIPQYPNFSNYSTTMPQANMAPPSYESVEKR